MRQIKPDDVRKLWDNFWTDKERAHRLLKPVSLVAPTDDPTVLFNVAGMQQLVPYLSGKAHPYGKRLYNIQPCLRTNDIEDIGDERHLSMFEMMGNWSLGDYFKKEALTRSVEFLVDKLGLNKEFLGCSIFGGYVDKNGQEIIPYDYEAEAVLLSLGIGQKKIKAISMTEGEKCDNFRGPAGAIGPCGPCAEFHYDRGDDWGPNDWNIGENDRFIEIWNNVFMEFYKHEDGTFTKLSQQNVDTGMGFERLMMILEGKETIFETGVFRDFIGTVQTLSGVPYPAYQKKEGVMSSEEKAVLRSYRIVTDHVRASNKLMVDGVRPSNDARGYVLRRLMRRARLHIKRLCVDPENPDFQQGNYKSIWYIIGEQSKDVQKLNNTMTREIEQLWMDEIDQFEKTLDRGQKHLEKIMAQGVNEVISGTDAFLLSDTYGFPLELTQEMAAEQGYEVDIVGYEQALQATRKKAKENAKDVFSRGVDRAQYLDGVPPTQFVGYDEWSVTDPQVVKQIVLDDGRLVMIFDTTPFYAESGGQTGDRGTLTFDDGSTKTIVDVKKYGGVFLHFVE